MSGPTKTQILQLQITRNIPQGHYKIEYLPLRGFYARQTGQPEPYNSDYYLGSNSTTASQQITTFAQQLAQDAQALDNQRDPPWLELLKDCYDVMREYPAYSKFGELAKRILPYF